MTWLAMQWSVHLTLLEEGPLSLPPYWVQEAWLPPCEELEGEGQGAFAFSTFTPLLMDRGEGRGERK